MSEANGNGRAILAVFAHPDDESLACGGTLARLADGGFRVTVVCASHGELGGPTGGIRDDQLAQQRVNELRAAADLLGVAEVFVGDHPDGDLQWLDVGELHAEIVTLIRRHTPAAVITFGHDGLYWHRDHVGVHERTTTAVASFGNEAPPLYYVTMKRGVMSDAVAAARARGWVAPAAGFWSLEPDAFGLHALDPTLTLDVGPWVARKLSAILCHRSQMVRDHPFSHLEPGEANRFLGHEYFHRADLPTTGAPVLETL